MNGWSNRETWVMVNWGFNDFEVEGFSSILENDSLSDHKKVQEIAIAMRDNFISYTEDLFPALLDGANPVSELINVAFNNIDWYEMAHTWYYDNVKA